MSWGEVPNGIGMKAVDLRTLLGQAYAFDEPTLREEEIANLPGWARDARFDLVAHVAPEDLETYKKLMDSSLQETMRNMIERRATPEMLMMRSLLQDRFGLSAHYEMRPERVYTLRVDKGGSKLKTAAGDAAHGNISWSATTIKGTSLPTPFVAMVLGITLEHHVIDATGLPGLFDIELHFQPQNAPPGAETSEPDLFTAVREQLGLRLEADKAPEPVLVIDAVHPPTPN